MALLDELTQLQAQLQTIVDGVRAAAIDPATGLPAGAPLGQHDVPGAPVLTPAEVADRVDDSTSSANAVQTGTVTNIDGSVTVTYADGSTATTHTDSTVTRTPAGTGTVPITGTPGTGATVTNADNSVTVTHADGSTTTTHTDGTVTTTGPTTTLPPAPPSSLGL